MRRALAVMVAIEATPDATGDPGGRHGARPRVLLYSHDSFGLGHIRRTVLIAADSPHAHEFALAPTVTLLKLPANDGARLYRHVAPAAGVWKTRSAILQDIVVTTGGG